MNKCVEPICGAKPAPARDCNESQRGTVMAGTKGALRKRRKANRWSAWKWWSYWASSRIVKGTMKDRNHKRSISDNWLQTVTGRFSSHTHE